MTDVLGSDPRLYWDARSSKEYDSNMGIRRTQKSFTLRGIELLKPRWGRMVIDIGCGSGISSLVLKENGLRVTGMDISEEMIKLSNSKGVRALVGDFNFIPFKDESFDYGFSVSALQWITGKNEKEISEKYKRVADEFYRILKNKGSFFVQFFPATGGELEIALNKFKKAGFGGYLVEDTFKNKRKDKKYIILKKG